MDRTLLIKYHFKPEGHKTNRHILAKDVFLALNHVKRPSVHYIIWNPNRHDEMIINVLQVSLCAKDDFLVWTSYILCAPDTKTTTWWDFKGCVKSWYSVRETQQHSYSFLPVIFSFFNSTYTTTPPSPCRKTQTCMPTLLSVSLSPAWFCTSCLASSWAWLVEGPVHRELRAQGLDKHPLGRAQRHRLSGREGGFRGESEVRIYCTSPNTLATSNSGSSCCSAAAIWGPLVLKET